MFLKAPEQAAQMSFRAKREIPEMLDFYSKTFAAEVSGLDKRKTYLVYCRSGNRSARSMELFKKLEFQKIFHLSSGINSWKSEGLPLVK